MHTSTKYDIPAAYGVTFLTLLVRDPRCIFAQWEVTESDRLDAVRRATALRGIADTHSPEQTQFVLRMYDVSNTVTDNGARHRSSSTLPGHSGMFSDFVVEGQLSRYIMTEPGRTLRAQIGFTVDDDPATFAAITASNTVRTPPGRASDEVDAHWSTLDELFRMAIAEAPAGSSVEWARMREERVDAFSPGFTVKGTVPMFVSVQGPSVDAVTQEEGSG